MAFKIKDGLFIGASSVFGPSAQLTTSSNLWADSTTVVTNLNADLLDGQHGNYYASAASIGNGILTIEGGTGVVGGGTFSANQSGNTTITLVHYTPPTVGVNQLSGTSNQFVSGIYFDQYGHATGATSTTVNFNVTDNYAFKTVSIDATDTGFTWGAANANTSQVASSNTDTITFVKGTGINLYTNTVAATDAVKIEHADTSTLSGAQGSAGIASITVDAMGHVTAVTTASYLITESDTLQSVTNRGKTTTNDITITNTTASSSTSTGALRVTGGVGITGNLNIGGSITSAGAVSITNNTASLGTNTGALTVEGGIGVTGAVNVGGTITVGATSSLAGVNASGIVTVTNNTNSTSTTSGALQVRGGLGVTGNIHGGGDLSIGGTAIIQGNLIVNGTSSIVQSTQVIIKDTILWLGGTGGSTAADIYDKGIIFNYWDGASAASKSGFFGWDESEDAFAYYQTATESSGVISGTLGTIKGGTFVGYLNGNALTATTADKVANSITFDATGGSSTSTTFNGSSPRIIDYRTVGAASSGHVHGNINNNGTIDTIKTIVSGDRLLIADSSNEYLITTGATFGGATTTYLRNDGTWAVPQDLFNGTVTSVTGTGGYGGLTLTGGGTTAVTLTLGGTPTGVWPISVSGTAGTASAVANTITFATSGGAASGTTYNGSAARTIDYSTVGGASAGHLHDTRYLQLSGGTLSGNLGLTATTASTSPATGALTVTGGVGITGALNIGGTVSTRGELQNSLSNGTVITSNNVSSTPVSTTSTTVIDSFAIATYRSGKYLIQITQGTNYQVSELLVIHNGTTTYDTEYAIKETSTSLANITTAVNGANVEVRVTMGSAVAATVKVERMLITV